MNTPTYPSIEDLVVKTREDLRSLLLSSRITKQELEIHIKNCRQIEEHLAAGGDVEDLQHLTDSGTFLVYRPNFQLPLHQYITKLEELIEIAAAIL